MNLNEPDYDIVKCPNCNGLFSLTKFAIHGHCPHCKYDAATLVDLAVREAALTRWIVVCLVLAIGCMFMYIFML